jgi:CrcB protein
VGGAPGADERLPIDPDLDPSDPSEPAPGHQRVLVPVRRSHPGVLSAIAAGGALGALARYELQLSWPVHPGAFPSSTLVINTSGAFLLGLVLTVASGRERRWEGTGANPWRYLRLFACVGILGAWTTMSAIAVESDTLLRAGDPLVALAYLAATVSAGIAAMVAGGRVAGLPRRLAAGGVPGGGRGR